MAGSRRTQALDTTRGARHGRWRPLLNLLFASVGYVGIRLCIAPVRIKLLTSLLSKEDYGLLTLIMLTVSVVTLLASCGSLEFMLRKLPGRDDQYQRGILRTIMTYFGGLALLISAIAFGIGAVWKPVQIGITAGDLLACGLILVFYVHISQLVFFLLSRSAYAQSRVLTLFHADAWFLPVLGLMWITDITVSVMLWLWAIWLLASLVLSQAFVRTRDLLQIRPSRESLRAILRFGVPLMPMIMGEWIFQFQDRYVLLALTDLEQVANFTLCFNIAWVGAGTALSMLDVLVTEFYKARNAVASTRIVDLIANKPLREAFTLLLRYALAIGIPVGLALWIGRVPIILLLSDSKYADAAHLMRWVAPIPILFIVVAISGRMLMALDRGQLVGKATLVAAGLHLMLGIALTAHFRDGRGMALAGCTAYGSLAVYLGGKARMLRWIEWRDLRPMRLLTFTLITTAGLQASVMTFHDQHWLALLSGGLISLAAMLALGIVRRADIVHLVTSMHTPR